MEDDWSRNGGVLVAEDDMLIAYEITAVLEQMGFKQIYVASDVPSGMEYLRDNPIKFAVLDVNLGKELVFPLASELVNRRIPFVFATATSKADLPPEWAEHRVLAKPVDNRKLAETIGSLH